MLKEYQILARVTLGTILVTIIWFRVDWSVALFALLVLIRVEIQDYFKK